MTEIELKFQPLFHPRSIAFIGASNNPKKWGFIILSNLLKGGFKRPIYPVNFDEKTIQGLKAYGKVSEIPDTPDLAIIVTPPNSFPGVINECVEKGIRAGVVITAGFAETGNDGEILQREIVECARRGGMILVGPNCNGIMRPSWNLYPVMPPVFPLPGQMAIVAQSGNVATSIVRRLMKKGLGCSCYVSSGNEAYLHCEDYFEYLAEDRETRIILSYIEGIRDGRRFLEIARKVTKKKPIVMLKVGRTQAGAKAARSHTAALAGTDLAFEGALRQAGIIRAETLDELTNIAISLFRQPLPKGRRIGVLTAGGGWGVIAADACERAGLELVQLPDSTISELDGILPPWWNRGNPVDLVAGLREGALLKSLEALLRCPDVDGVILLGIMPALPVGKIQSLTNKGISSEAIDSILQMIVDIYDQFMELIEKYQKPVITGSEIPVPIGDLEQRIAIALGRKGYVCYPSPEEAVLAMSGLVAYSEYLMASN
jgi:acyl-CoA synthetase (NDP forming)